jgi:hypothetical protein
LTGTHNDTVCFGESIVVNGTTYDATNLTGIEVFTNVGANGCDSTVTVNLTIENELTGTHNETVCFGESIVVNGTTYDASNLTGTEVFTNVGPNGCDSMVTVNLTIENTIDINTTTNNQTITADLVGATYQWLDCDNGNSEISGETGQSFTATTDGNYAVIVISNGCSDTSACTTISNVGITENNFGNTINVYPNPTTGNFSIDLGFLYEEIEVTVCNLNGSTILSKNYTQSQLVQLDLDEPAGIYILKITSAAKQAVVRLVKK